MSLNDAHDDSWTAVDATPEGTDGPTPPPSTPSASEAATIQKRLSLSQWLVNADLEKYAEKIIEATDAKKIDDLGLLTPSAVEQCVVDVGLKPVPAEKLRRAIAEIELRAVDSKLRPSGVDVQGPPTGAGVNDAPPTGTATVVIEPTLHEFEEAIAICIDRSGSMGTPFKEVTWYEENFVRGEERQAVTERPRMEAVKAMFYAFRDRIDSLGQPGSHQLGLLQFDNRVETLSGLSDDLNRFEAIVDDMKKGGQTAIFSAIEQAASMLAPVATVSPSTDLRILALTDGNSNCGVSPERALTAACEIGAVVDAIIVGDSPDANLRKIVAATGGLCFQIRTLGEGFELLEGEGVASLKARRGGTAKPPFVRKPPPVDFGAIEQKAFAMTAPVARLAKSLQPQKVVDVSTRIAAIDSGAGGGGAHDGVAEGAGDASGAASKRILKELRAVAAGDSNVWLHSGEGVHIFPSESDLTSWRVLVEGPPGSPFEGGRFALDVKIPDDYPFKPPVVRFETPVYHCNVSDSGGICLDVLKESWSAALSVPKALEAVRSLLAQPDTDNALRQWIAELTLAHTKHGDPRYAEEAARRTREHAGRTVAEWTKEWGAAA